MFAIEYCRTEDLPSDENGDALHDGAVFTVENFVTEPEALAAARKLLAENDQAYAAGKATLAYGSVRVFEWIRRRSRWTGLMEDLETRETHLMHADDVPDWSALPDYDDDE